MSSTSHPTILTLLLLMVSPSFAGNPIVPGWYADPDVQIFGKTFWVFPTFSDKYEKQTFLDAFSSSDLKVWTRHPRIIDTKAITWAKKAMWAPCVVEKDGKFYLFFSANDVHPGEIGGIGVAIADKPDGPYRDLLGKPLLDGNLNGAQPIDQAVFKDPADGKWWIVYGGWKHCNLGQLSDDFTHLVPQPDGQLVHEITPDGYVEGPMMFFRNRKVYFMWSEGGWTNETYQVAYAIGESIHGPFKRIGTVIEKNPAIGSGAGHHSILKIPDRNEYYIAYHRRPPGETNGNHRVTCIDKMEFSEDGTIKPVKMTNEGVETKP